MASYINNLTRLEISLVDEEKHSLELVPKRSNPFDAGLDLKTRKAFNIFPDEILKIPTGIKISVPKGNVGYVMSRSGLSLKGVVVINAPGVIDSGFSGEICVLLVNMSHNTHSFERGDRIAQLIVQSVHLCEPVLVESVHQKDSARGENGFGSTGV